ncbi:ABC transporter ATP-binding protein [Pseudomarimonas arenosa]|uniref:ABC transporter ATP-binding protein n=1 Tax=Pseudomarimonas arenosa TaxID=2774145 RepID=A0AAW3ZNK9_9GAMM|nr:ABC transporter ATP-binding protein [Pseudomarimonas arenosa]MBD8526510.1 ABC transporter ATP-binding protein [Pseudomarimonas arenosa]
MTRDEHPLKCIDLYKHYGKKPVLEGIHLSLAPGQVLGLIGRNGAGKSTLIRCLLGLSEADQGQALVFGEKSYFMSDATKARLTYVPQQPTSLGWLRVSDMLAFVARFYPQWDQAMVERLLDRWEIDRKQSMAKLSPGERQRLALIRALAPRPDLLVLDEPAAALDPVARRDLLRQIALQASDMGTTVLFSSHILSDLERVASHVAFLDRGKLLIDGELDGFKERFGRLHVGPEMAARLPAKLAGELRRRPAADAGLSLLLSMDAQAAWPEDLRQACHQATPLGLEDLFVEVVE